LRLAVQDAHRSALALMIDLHTTGGAVPRDPTVPAPSFPVADAGLTKREREVATLIADGLSNRGIATLLSTSQRTAESHVEHILRKLGFTSRVQVAAWIAAACGSGLEPMPHC
jgi:DNA-binding NarL/FixJ family response regulator